MAATDLKPLQQAISEMLNGLECEIGRQLACAIDCTEVPNIIENPQLVSACHQLPSILRNPANKFLDTFSNHYRQLKWRQPGFGKLPGAISSNMAVCEILGAEGPLINSQCRIGFLLQLEDTHYPTHSHAAEELYLVLSGQAGWSVDNQPATARSPGEFIHHKPWQPHAMETWDEPLLTLWGWTGDISSASYSIWQPRS